MQLFLFQNANYVYNYISEYWMRFISLFSSFFNLKFEYFSIWNGSYILAIYFDFEIWHWRELFSRKIPSSLALEGKGTYSFFRKVSSKISIGPWSIWRISVRELNGMSQGRLSFPRKKQWSKKKQEAGVSFNDWLTHVTHIRFHSISN